MLFSTILSFVNQGEASMMSTSQVNSSLATSQATPLSSDSRPKMGGEFPTSSDSRSIHGSGGGKTVTFDEHNQVQETPLMFSRCSSLGSLSSFDAHSVHRSDLILFFFSFLN